MMKQAGDLYSFDDVLKEEYCDQNLGFGANGGVWHILLISAYSLISAYCFVGLNTRY